MKVSFSDVSFAIFCNFQNDNFLVIRSIQDICVAEKPGNGLERKIKVIFKTKMSIYQSEGNLVEKICLEHHTPLRPNNQKNACNENTSLV